jgi:hypothetical protein
VAELADALDSGSSVGNDVEVQVLSSAPKIPGPFKPPNSSQRQSEKRLLDEEKFWENIQDAIAKRRAKFVFAVTHRSSKKEGTLNELNCARGVEKELWTALMSV